MSFFPFQNPTKKNESAPRWFAGINVASNGRRIEAAMIGVHGRGSGAPVEIRKAISFDLPREITEIFSELQIAVAHRDAETDSETTVPFSPYVQLLRELAGVEDEAIEELLGESRLTKNDVLAVGVHDPGLCLSTPQGFYYQSLCDAPLLAEQTGLNIVDAFPLQDVASGGHGGPVLPLPAWIFLKSESRDRIVLDLGRTARMMYLPKAKNAFSHQRIQYRDIVPCGSLLDALTWELTKGETSIDVGGRLTVQGCQIPELLDQFRKLAPTRESWHPLGLSPERHLKTAFASADAGHSYQDVLCTTSIYIAEAVSETLRTALAEHANDRTPDTSEPELLLTGAGRLHGMLLNLISSQLGKRSMIPINQLGFPTETFDALCVAMLTLMAVDRIPSGLPTLTGSETSKPLGRITPGGIGVWQRLLQEMAGTKPPLRTLRSAM